MKYNIRGYVVLCVSFLILFFGLKTLGFPNSIIFETTSIMYFEYGMLGFFLIISFLIMCNLMRKGEFLKTKKILSDKNEEIKNVLNAINKSNAMIEFCPNGGIITANENFLDIMGYDISDVVGKKHSMFVNKRVANSKKYVKFWDDLRLGKFKSGDFVRYTKLGEEVHIHGTYNPIFNKDGYVIKIMKIVTNITESVNQKLELEKKNTYLEHAAKILRHDMHSGINTYIPLAVAFVSPEGEVVKISYISPYYAKVVTSDRNCDMAIEANYDFFTRNKVEIGQKVEICTGEDDIYVKFIEK